jgi:type IV pilus assembly protein PilY1
VTYSHTIQTCWSYWKQGSFSNGDSQRLTNSCDDALSGWGICSADDTTVCTTDSNCSALGLGTCNHGPAAIRPGNPAYVCSNEYFGQFCTWSWNEATHTGSCSWGGTDTQRDAVFAAFCGSSLPPTVIDPTDSAASTANYESVPAMLSGIGVESQLGSPIGTLPVKLATTTAPTGLVQQFADQIRTGVMTFDQFGSGTEASSLSSAVIRIPKVCSNDETKLCAIDKDCGSGSCNNASSTQNMDGAKILYPVGTGKCATMTATPCSSDPACIAADSASRCYKGFCGTKTTSVCTTDANCTPVTQICVTNSAGDHTATDSLVNTIDTIRADAWTPFAEAFYNILGYFAQIPTGTNAGKSRIDLRLNSINTTSTVFSTSTPAAAPKDFNESLNPSEYRCQQNYVLMITDGSSTADQNSSVSSLASLYAPQAGLTAGTCSNYLGSKNLPIMAWIGKNQNIATFRTATPATPLVCSGNSAACTKDADCPSGQTCLNIPRNPRDSITSYVVYNGGSNGQTGACDSFTLLNNTATAGGTSLYVANNPAALSTSLRSVFQDVAAKAASGTAASILSNSEGSGANILQAVFYPKKIFANATSTNWIGEMQNLWYFVDPYINNSTIREDTDGDLKLNLVNDYIVRFAFDPTSDKTMVQRYVDSNGDGVAEGTVGGLIDPDDVKSIWRAGKLLWSRNISTSPRTIKTTIDGTSLIDFSSSTYPGGSVTSNAATLAPYLNVATADAPTLINWVHGADQASLRPRTVDIKDPVTNVVSTGVWRLGDIISSTPRVQSTVRLNTYNLTAPGGYSDGSYDSYTNSANYKDHGMVYVGANDGMLHAFNLGILNVQATGNLKATLTDPGNIGLGKEMWAFIPRSALPYLQYSADPTYEHLYYIDGRTVIFDASIGDTNSGECIKSTYWKCSKPRGGAGSIMVDSSNNLDSNKNIWRSIVISGMGTGGATTKTCTTGSNCVQTPLTDPNDSSKGLGYSSYFALDVTDPRNPQLLWEFSHPDLGYSTTGPAIVRLGDRDKNGRWFAVFGSGPTGPIETSTHQFQAGSNQSLKYFVVDLRTGALVKEIDTAIGNAFSGTLLGAAIDADRWDTSAVGNYQDDALYVGYVKESASGSGVFTKGGVGRIMIDPVASGIDPSDANIQSSFHWSTVLDDIGPVTTAISRLQNRNALTKALWLFFGSGRYYYRAGAVLDDYTGRRALFGIKEPCYARNGVGNHLDHASCTDAQTGAIVNQTDVNALGSLSTVSGTDGGWKIDLDPSTTAEGAERVVTDTVALTNGTVFFTSFKPTTDICGYGGNSFLWGVKYDSGGQPAANALTGKALIQLSTGEFREVDLASAFTDKLNRRMASPMTGKPPSDAPPIISSSGNKPLKKVLHIQEH